MAQPQYDPRQPLLDVLAQNNITVKEMNYSLQDAAEEAERLIPKLIEKHVTGSTVKAAQLALVLRELRVMQSALWGDLGQSTRSGVVAAALQAASTAEGVLWRYLGKHGVDIPQLRAAQVQQAKMGIAAMLAKSYNGVPLSRAVYKSQALSQGWVDRKIKQGLLLGNNAKAIAKSVKDLISPDVKGGVAYAAHRLARTEINEAYKTAQEQRHADEPWVTGMEWNLSRSHPSPDICDELESADHYNLGPGIYPVGKRPKSHPQCMCYLTTASVSEDEFEKQLLAGNYNAFIDEKAYAAQVPGLPCP